MYTIKNQECALYIINYQKQGGPYEVHDLDHEEPACQVKLDDKIIAASHSWVSCACFVKWDIWNRIKFSSKRDSGIEFGAAYLPQWEVLDACTVNSLI